MALAARQFVRPALSAGLVETQLLLLKTVSGSHSLRLNNRKLYCFVLDLIKDAEEVVSRVRETVLELGFAEKDFCKPLNVKSKFHPKGNCHRKLVVFSVTHGNYCHPY